MAKNTTSIIQASGRRAAISFNTDSCQAIVFLTQEEFLLFMRQMFDYRDKYKDEFLEVIQRMKK